MQGKLDAMRHLSKIEGIQNTQRKSYTVETKSDKANFIYTINSLFLEQTASRKGSFVSFRLKIF